MRSCIQCASHHSFSVRGRRPRTPDTLARGDPEAPLRSRGSLAALVRDVTDSTSLCSFAVRGRLSCPRPRAACAGCGLVSSARPTTLFQFGGVAPEPPTRSLAGTPKPRSARVAHSLRSFATSRIPPPSVASPLGDALAARGLVQLAQDAVLYPVRVPPLFFSSGASPPNPRHARSRGPRSPAPLAWL